MGAHGRKQTGLPDVAMCSSVLLGGPGHGRGHAEGLGHAGSAPDLHRAPDVNRKPDLGATHHSPGPLNCVAFPPKLELLGCHSLPGLLGELHLMTRGSAADRSWTSQALNTPVTATVLPWQPVSLAN